jgi:hypothetical protein
MKILKYIYKIGGESGCLSQEGRREEGTAIDGLLQIGVECLYSGWSAGEV